ncbi:MAG: hypothetical protein JRM80_10510 [Nitrososphaerota archaeon]|nr:hypothetical protein [Nitrososphaerota archaeon]
MMIGMAKAMGAVSVVNAIASGKGATVSVELPTAAKVAVREERGSWRALNNGQETKSRLVLSSLRLAISMLGRDPGRYSGSVDTTLSAPMGVGLKTSSSTSIAVALAVWDAFGKSSPPSAEILNAASVRPCRVESASPERWTTPLHACSGE